MNKIIYKILINGNEHVTFHDLEDLMMLIKGMSKYYNELTIDINFTTKEVIEDGQSVQ